MRPGTINGLGLRELSVLTIVPNSTSKFDSANALINLRSVPMATAAANAVIDLVDARGATPRGPRRHRIGSSELRITNSLYIAVALRLIP